MEREEFERLVDAALETIPDQIASLVRNVAVIVEDDAPPEDPHLLGLYDGIALTERYGEPLMELPDRIFIYRRPLLAFCEDAENLAEEVRVTVVHEVAHHFGIDDDRLDELGYA
jgi:predicted Zn-dependent protease with MMP-like domain